MEGFEHRHCTIRRTHLYLFTLAAAGPWRRRVVAKHEGPNQSQPKLLQPNRCDQTAATTQPQLTKQPQLNGRNQTGTTRQPQPNGHKPKVNTKRSASRARVRARTSSDDNMTATMTTKLSTPCQPPQRATKNSINTRFGRQLSRGMSLPIPTSQPETKRP